MIICFTIGLCIAKMKSFLLFLHELYRSVQYFFLIKVSHKLFSSVPNGVVIWFFSLVALLKHT